jgi:hypothetical protein
MTSPADAREYYEVRTYKLRSAEKAAAFDRAMETAFLPVLKRAGAGPVGVFKPKSPADDDPDLRYVVTTYPSLEVFEKVREAFANATEGEMAAAAEYLASGDGGAEDAAFERIENALLAAFPSHPAIKPPAGAAPTRFFELRVYESPTELKGVRKVEMFGEGGELAIFDEVGLRGVFYGQAEVAPNLPQLTYMLAYDSEEEKAAAWDRFWTSPAWAALQDQERYAGTVSKIHSIDLVALPFSDIR